MRQQSADLLEKTVPTRRGGLGVEKWGGLPEGLALSVQEEEGGYCSGRHLPPTAATSRGCEKEGESPVVSSGPR